MFYKVSSYNASIRWYSMFFKEVRICNSPPKWREGMEWRVRENLYHFLYYAISSSLTEKERERGLADPPPKKKGKKCTHRPETHEVILLYLYWLYPVKPKFVPLSFHLYFQKKFGGAEDIQAPSIASQKLYTIWRITLHLYYFFPTSSKLYRFPLPVIFKNRPQKMKRTERVYVSRLLISNWWAE